MSDELDSPDDRVEVTIKLFPNEVEQIEYELEHGPNLLGGDSVEEWIVNAITRMFNIIHDRTEKEELAVVDVPPELTKRGQFAVRRRAERGTLLAEELSQDPIEYDLEDELRENLLYAIMEDAEWRCEGEPLASN